MDQQIAHVALDAGLLHLGELLRAAGYAFTTPTPATCGRVVARGGTARSVADVFGWSRPFDPAILPERIVAAMHRAGVVEQAGGLLRSRVRFSTLDGMLFAHSAYPTIEADAVFFGPDTYRFCQAIGRVLGAGPAPRRAVELCAGAGPGAIAIARAFSDAEVLAGDINHRALAMCRVNAALAGVSVEPVESDLFDRLEGDFDLIVANPPYLNDPGQRAYRHGGGAHGALLSLRLLDAALPRLRPGGRLALYTGVAILDGVDPVRAAAERSAGDWPITYDEIDPDVFGEELEQPAYADADRIAAVLVTIARPNKRS